MGGSEMWVNSLHRSRLTEPLLTIVHDGYAAHTQLWWGPIVPVQPGDTVYYFKGPCGIAIEWVEGHILPEHAEL